MKRKIDNTSRKSNTEHHISITNTEQSNLSAFQFLKSLPRNLDRQVLKSYKRNRASEIIDSEIAEGFTTSFRTSQQAFSIPVSWTLTKTALLNLLGITSYEGYEEVNGIRFYAGINGDQQLTLIAVSTEEGIDCNNDLTIDDEYPYYDYADPCPNNCSNSGNLKVLGGLAAQVQVQKVN